MGKLAQWTYQVMKEGYQDDYLGQSTFLHWHSFFTKGRELAALEPHSGRPTSIVIETNINSVVVAIINDDCHMSVRTLEIMVHIPNSSMHRTLSEHLQMHCICSTWVPHFLTCEQIERHVKVAKEWVRSIKRDRNFLSKVISCDEMWTHYFNPKSKCEREV